MEPIDSGLMILRPKQAFLDWVNSWSPKDQKLTLEEVREDAPAVLIPEFDDDEDALVFVKDNAQEILMNEISEWCLEPSLWPKKQDFATLTQWFEIEFHSTVYAWGLSGEQEQNGE